MCVRYTNKNCAENGIIFENSEESNPGKISDV